MSRLYKGAIKIVLLGCLLIYAIPVAAQTPDPREAQLRAVLAELINRLQVEIAKRPVVTKIIPVANEGRIIKAVYRVENETRSLIAGVQKNSHGAYWDLIQKVIPEDVVGQYLREFVVYEDSTGSRDAYVETLTEGRNDLWRIGINASTEFAPTEARLQEVLLIHEMAHLVSLNDSQIDYSIPESLCATYYAEGGCVRSDSYYYDLVSSFWNSADLAAASETDERTPEYYYTDPDRFVSEYASLNPGEDWAENFTVFVTTPFPGGTSVADQKVRSLYSYPDLVALRTEMRSRLGY